MLMRARAMLVNASASSTFELVDRGGFDITYLDGRNIKGSYFNDTVTFGEGKIENQQLGLASDTVRATGLMGLGFSANVAARKKYPTVIDNMVEQGLIETRAFSLYLNDLDSDAGTVLFGAIDSKKYIGDLAILELSPESSSGTNNVTSFNVHISGFDLKNAKGNKPVNLPNLDSMAILDSGSTISLLPDDQVQELWDEFNVVTSKDTLTPYIDCAYRGDKGKGYVFEFVFDGKTIQVPIDEMVIDAYADVQALFKQYLIRNKGLTEVSDWDSVCMFGIGSTADFDIDTDKFTLLGDTFLRSAYVVYDLDNERLAIAQANLNSTDSNIVDITPGDLPVVSGVKSAFSLLLYPHFSTPLCLVPASANTPQAKKATRAPAPRAARATTTTTAPPASSRPPPWPSPPSWACAPPCWPSKAHLTFDI